MVVWGGVISTSIGALYLAGILPGLLIAGAQMATVHVTPSLQVSVYRSRLWRIRDLRYPSLPVCSRRDYLGAICWYGLRHRVGRIAVLYAAICHRRRSRDDMTPLYHAFAATGRWVRSHCLRRHSSVWLAPPLPIRDCAGECHFLGSVTSGFYAFASSSSVLSRRNPLDHLVAPPTSARRSAQHRCSSRSSASSRWRRPVTPHMVGAYYLMPRSQVPLKFPLTDTLIMLCRCLSCARCIFWPELRCFAATDLAECLK